MNRISVLLQTGEPAPKLYEKLERPSETMKYFGGYYEGMNGPHDHDYYQPTTQDWEDYYVSRQSTGNWPDGPRETYLERENEELTQQRDELADALAEAVEWAEYLELACPGTKYQR